MADELTAAVDHVESTLRGVERALDRLLAGTYRTCELCGEVIDEDLLAADPLRAGCRAHPTLAD